LTNERRWFVKLGGKKAGEFLMGAKESSKIKFGTDGWRGIISDNFTFDNVRRVAQAIADYYTAKTQRFSTCPRRRGKNATIKIAVGYDTRFLSDKYAQIMAEVLANNGISVLLSEKSIPTPALSFAVKSQQLAAGVMITASHNPYFYNGIKIKTSSGGAAGVEITKALEERVAKGIGKGKAAAVIVRQDLTKDYVKFLRSYIDLKQLKKAHFKVLVDVMYGSGNGFIAQVLKGTCVKLDFIHNCINPSFGKAGRPEPVLENLGEVRQIVKQGGYDLALVLDGDADRIAAFCANGVFIHPQKILGLLALHLLRNRRLTGAIVKTIVGSTLIDNISHKLGLRLYETPVGFKYISDLMQKKDVLVGGEEAGGMGFRDYIPERDGTLAGLLLLEMMSYAHKPMLEILNEMEEEFGRYYYLREDIRIKQQVSGIRYQVSGLRSLLGKKVIQMKDYDGIKLICADESWLMWRASGTEPITRVYAEAKSLRRAKELLAFGKGLILNA
jgi:phosphomannomutase